MVSEDEDLEFLRLAALQSRKTKEAQNAGLATRRSRGNGRFKNLEHTNDHEHKNRYRHPHPGKLKRGNMNAFRVTTNLISIPIAHTENEVKKVPMKTNLIIKPSRTELEQSSKFRRYEHSDDSESESETETKKSDDEPEEADEIPTSEPATPAKARSERGDSLDRLMDELENEIAGVKPANDVKKIPEVKKTETKKKTKKNIKNIPKPKTFEEEIKYDENIKVKIESEEEDVVETTVIPPPIDLEIKEELDDELKVTEVKIKVEIQSPTRDESLKTDLSPQAQKESVIGYEKSPRAIEKSPRSLEKSPRAEKLPRDEISPRYSEKPSTYRNGPYSQWPCPDRPERVDRPMYNMRPISPLHINADVLNTITMAPLSPRSAAFVLQNREMIAKRTQLPKRRSISSSSSSSYDSRRSRSRTPIRKRSVSPYSRSRYSPPRRYSPPPRRRSISPKRNDFVATRRRSRSPERTYKRRSFSPKAARTPSPRRRRSRSPINRRSPKPDLRNRLGPRPNLPTRRKEERPVKRRVESLNSLSLTPSPKCSTQNQMSPSEKKEILKDNPPSTSPKEVDSVLEARRRKFESNKPIDVAGGIIKLKSIKEPEVQEDESMPAESLSDGELKEAPLMELSDVEDIICGDTTDLQELWVSEDSDNENEGRFKTGNNKHSHRIHSPRKVLVDRSSEIAPRRRKRSHDRGERPHRSHRERKEHKKMKRYNDEVVINAVGDERKVSRKLNKISIRGERGVKETMVIDEGQKQETMRVVIGDKKGMKDQIRKVTEVVIEDDKGSTPPPRVELKKADEDDYEPEIVFEDDNDDASAAPDDLRTELSRRRAQRTKLTSLPSGPPTRLLQNAFQDISKKSKSTTGLRRSKKDLRNERSSGKLPIHLRLGTTDNFDTDLAIAKKSKQLSEYDGRKKRIGLQV